MSRGFAGSTSVVPTKPIVPSLSDPRWLLGAYALCFVAFAIQTPGFARTPTQFLVGFLRV